MAFVDRLVHAVFDRIAGHSAHSHGGSGGIELPGGQVRSGSPPANEHTRCLPLDKEYDAEAVEDESGASIRALAHVQERTRLLMMASVVSAAIVLHNIPEGMAT